MTLIKSAVRQILRSMGYSIARTSRQQRPTYFDGILEGVSSQKSKLRIVQVGANDGITNDPLHDFIMTHQGGVDAVLFEPNPEAFAKLNITYHNIKNVLLLDVAIGPVGTLELYSIAPQFHDLYRKSGQNPLGVTSSEVDHVIRYVRRYLRVAPEIAHTMVERNVIPCRPISRAIPSDWDHFDVLQVDVEGADDSVIFNSSIDTYRPYVINFEHKHLSCERMTVLRDFLERRSYKLREWSASDTIALRVI